MFIIIKADVVLHATGLLRMTDKALYHWLCNFVRYVFSVHVHRVYVSCICYLFVFIHVYIVYVCVCRKARTDEKWWDFVSKSFGKWAAVRRPNVKIKFHVTDLKRLERNVAFMCGVSFHFSVWEVKTCCVVDRKEVRRDFQTHEEPPQRHSIRT